MRVTCTPPPEKTYVVHLTLTQRELDVLVELTGGLAGGGFGRSVTDSIWHALEQHRSEECSYFLEHARSNDSVK